MLIITRTRPSIDIPFFLESLPAEVRATIYDYTVANPLPQTIVVSDDNLTRTANIDMTLIEYTNWGKAFNKAIPALIGQRETYQLAVGITQTFKVV